MQFCPKCGNKYFVVDSIEIAQREIVGGAKEIKNHNILTRLKNLKDITDMLKSIDVEKFLKSREYTSISAEERGFLYNKIQDALELSKKDISKHKVADVEKPFFLFCTNCLNNEILKPNTKVHSMIYRRKSNMEKTDYTHLLDDKRLPRTKLYKCQNKKCISYKDLSKKEAVFMTDTEHTNIVYVCKACKTQWIS
jgi:hypothetical protein